MNAPLVDKLQRPLRDLRISVTDRCNFRCGYCMPESHYTEQFQFLPRSELLTFEEIVRVVTVYVRLGVTKLRLTGGEPLLRKDLPVLVHMLSKIEKVDDLALTTNGALLAAQAGALRDAGLMRVTVSLDSLKQAEFLNMSGNRGDLHAVLNSIARAETVGFSPIKINTVIRRGINESAILELVAFSRGAGHIIRFIEYMDVGNINGWRDDDVVPSSEILERIQEYFPLEPLEPNYHGEVAERYRFLDGGGEIGFISSVSEPFCGSCTRARLSAEGKMYTCLFASDGFDLRESLRRGASDDDLADLINGCWQKRSDRYSEQRAASRTDPRTNKIVEMYQIGG